MNPGIGVPEMLIVLVIALVVVGPEQLPILMRRVGRMVGQARMMARDFQRSFDDIGRQAELDELRKEISALKQANPLSEIEREVSGAASDAAVDAEALRRLKLRDAGLPDDRPTIHPVAKPGIDADAPGALGAKPAAEPAAKQPAAKPAAAAAAKPAMRCAPEDMDEDE